MSHFGWIEWNEAMALRKDDPSFYALIGAAMMKADTFNVMALDLAFPGFRDQVQARYDAPMGVLPSDPDGVKERAFGSVEEYENVMALRERLGLGVSR